MNEIIRESAPSLSSELPSNLRVWLDQGRLVMLTLEVVQGIAWSRPEGRFLSAGGENYAPQSLMALTIYCHATGSHDLQTFEGSLERDEALRFFCAQIPPDANTLRRFRHIHRELIVRVLERLLERAWETRPGTARACRDTKLDLENSSACPRELTDRPDFHRDAVERVQEGIFLECIARDV